MKRFTLHQGDSREVLRSFADASVDSIVCDPPYGLSFMGKRWDYDVPSSELWAECLRVLKPGGHLVAFAGTRTQHRMAVRIEDAGFEIRDMLAWLYGSGFPKSLDVSKAIDKAAGVERAVTREASADYKPGTNVNWDSRGSEQREQREQREQPATAQAAAWDGWGTALKPALEPITLARKPLSGTVAATVLQHGTGALNIDACRVDYASQEDKAAAAAEQRSRQVPNRNESHEWGIQQQAVTAEQFMQNTGRWPANVLHDDSPEVVALFPETSSGVMTAGTVRAAQGGPGSVCYGTYGGNATNTNTPGDSGSAARFFYAAKASQEDRNEGCQFITPKQYSHDGRETPIDNAYQRNSSNSSNSHPTVKPTDLMRYLCRLVTPKGGTVLDPFMGSGSTGKAAMLEGFNFIGIDLSAEYIEIARARIEFALRQGHQPSLLEAA